MHRATLGEAAESPMVIPVNLVSLGTAAVARPHAGSDAVWLGRRLFRRPGAGRTDFDQAFNSLFVVRIAGNVLGTECLGSVDFAVRNLAEHGEIRAWCWVIAAAAR